MISSFFKSELVDRADELVAKALVNESITITELNKTVYSDSITIEMDLPPDTIVTRIDFLDSQDSITTTISGIDIDTSVTTVFSHNMQFIQGGGI